MALGSTECTAEVGSRRAAATESPPIAHVDPVTGEISPVDTGVLAPATTDGIPYESMEVVALDSGQLALVRRYVQDGVHVTNFTEVVTSGTYVLPSEPAGPGFTAEECRNVSCLGDCVVHSLNSGTPYCDCVPMDVSVNDEPCPDDPCMWNESDGSQTPLY